MMALTATATKTLCESVMKTLGMENVFVVSESPDKPNIVYNVHSFESMEINFKPLINKLRTERTSMGRTLIYCRSQDACAKLYLWSVKCCLGSNSTDPPMAPDTPEFRLFDCFMSATHPKVKESIIIICNDFKKSTNANCNCHGSI